MKITPNCTESLDFNIIALYFHDHATPSIALSDLLWSFMAKCGFD